MLKRFHPALSEGQFILQVAFYACLIWSGCCCSSFSLKTKKEGVGLMEVMVAMGQEKVEEKSEIELMEK
jgi:hypothetical protein